LSIAVIYKAILTTQVLTQKGCCKTPFRKFDVFDKSVQALELTGVASF
jgi:hypothetical protein